MRESSHRQQPFTERQHCTEPQAGRSQGTPDIWLGTWASGLHVCLCAYLLSPLFKPHRAPTQLKITLQN